MDFLPLWIWPLIVCGLALALRLVLPSGVRRPARKFPQGAPLQRRISVLSAIGWFRGVLSGQAKVPVHEPVTILGRKVVGPQLSILLVRIWDEELAVCLQVGSPATVLTQRKMTADTGNELVSGNEDSSAHSFRAMLERQCS